MIQKIVLNNQASGQFNNGEIIENKPIGFPQDGGIKYYSNIFYWAHATANTNSTIGLHPHRGFEIMTFVLKGNINHYDTLLNKWIKLKEGDIQLIKSGSGISHAEMLEKNSEIFQIWFHPDLRVTLKQKPTYNDYDFKSFVANQNVTTIVGKDSPIKLESEKIEVFKVELNESTFQIECENEYIYSIYITEGKLKIQQVGDVQKDDFIIVENEKTVHIEVSERGCLYYIKSPILPSYPTY